MSSDKASEWRPVEAFNALGKYALVILNTAVVDESRLVSLWNGASYRVTVDGGTNRWHGIVGRNKGQIQRPVPDLITGDLDSIAPEVLQFYSAKADCRVVKTPDQNFTDFTKSLQELAKMSSSLQVDKVTVFAEHTGRLDQIFGICETLYHAMLHMPGLCRHVYVASSHSVEWLLPEGHHTIHLPPSGPSRDSLYCGLIPLGDPAHNVSTTGLKWNLDNQTLAFGTLVSTSNRLAPGAETVTIKATKPLLWTMELKATVL